VVRLRVRNKEDTEMMATRNIEKMASIDAQLRLLAPRKVSDDDKLVEYDALLLDRFLDILQDLHGEDIRQTVMSILLLFFKKMSFLGQLHGFIKPHFNFCNEELFLVFEIGLLYTFINCLI